MAGPLPADLQTAVGAVTAAEAAFKAKIEEYRTKFANPYQAAARGYVDEVIDPAETRLRLARSLPMLSGKRESRPAKKHGNLPL